MLANRQRPAVTDKLPRQIRRLWPAKRPSGHASRALQRRSESTVVAGAKSIVPADRSLFCTGGFAWQEESPAPCTNYPPSADIADRHSSSHFRSRNVSPHAMLDQICFSMIDGACPDPPIIRPQFPTIIVRFVLAMGLRCFESTLWNHVVEQIARTLTHFRICCSILLSRGPASLCVTTDIALQARLRCFGWSGWGSEMDDFCSIGRVWTYRTYMVLSTFYATYHRVKNVS